MKRLIILLVIQFFFFGVLFAQKIIRFSEYDSLLKKKSWKSLSLDTARLKKQKELYFLSSDSTLKLLPRNEVFTRGDSIYLNKLARKKFDLNLNLLPVINLKYALPVRPLLYFSLLDYSSKPTFDRFSRFYNPFDKNSRDLQYLWSGGVTCLKEIGYSGNFHDQSKPKYLIHIIRDGKKIKGFGLEVFDDDDW